MRPTDWRSPETYEEQRSLDAPGFAWEFLRRNPCFVKDVRELRRAALKGTTKRADLEAFAQRWGLRILSKAPADQDRQDSLDTGYSAECRRSNNNRRRSG
jgi:hypothetical protein